MALIMMDKHRKTCDWARAYQEDDDNDCGDRNTDRRQKQAVDKCANNTPDYVADQTKSAAFHDAACEPSCDATDDQPDNQCLDNARQIGKRCAARGTVGLRKIKIRK
jgi:hypothetical protein